MSTIENLYLQSFDQFLVRKLRCGIHMEFFGGWKIQLAIVCDKIDCKKKKINK